MSARLDAAPHGPEDLVALVHLISGGRIPGFCVFNLHSFFFLDDRNLPTHSRYYSRVVFIMTSLSTELILEIIDQLGHEYLLLQDRWEYSLATKKALYNVAQVCRTWKWHAYPYIHGSLACECSDAVKNTVIRLRAADAPTEVVNAHTLTLKFGGESWGGDPVTDSSCSLDTLIKSLPRLRRLRIERYDGDVNVAWRDRIGNYPDVQSAILSVISSDRLASLCIGGISIPKDFFRYLGPSLTSLKIADVIWEDVSINLSTSKHTHSKCALRSLRIESLSYQRRYLSLRDLLDGNEEDNEREVPMLQSLETIAISGTNRHETPSVYALLEKEAFPQLTKIVFLDGLDGLSEKYYSSRQGISMDLLHAKFESITLPTYFLTASYSFDFPMRLRDFLVSSTNYSKVKKLTLNLSSPFSAHDQKRMYQGPLTFGDEWRVIDEELSAGEAWKGLQEVVLDMTDGVPRNWEEEDIQRIREYLWTRTFPRLSKTVKLTVLL